MIKKLIGVVAILSMLAPMAVSAATFSSIYFNNGFQSVSTNPGSTVSGNVLLTVAPNEAVQCIETIVDGLQPQYTSVGGQNGYQQSTMPFNVPFNVTVPQITGSYQLQVIPFGVSGSINGQNLGCSGSQLGSATTFSNAVNVISTGGSTGSTGSSPSGIPADVWAKFLAYMSAGATPAPVNGNKAKCDAVKPFTGAPSNTYSALGVQLQSALLLNNPYAIPALKPGSSVPMGWRGVQTEAALASYNSMYQCS